MLKKVKRNNHIVDPPDYPEPLQSWISSSLVQAQGCFFWSLTWEDRYCVYVLSTKSAVTERRSSSGLRPKLGSSIISHLSKCRNDSSSFDGDLAPGEWLFGSFGFSSLSCVRGPRELVAGVTAAAWFCSMHSVTLSETSNNATVGCCLAVSILCAGVFSRSPPLGVKHSEDKSWSWTASSLGLGAPANCILL